MTIIEKEECEFYARTDKAYTFKTTVDIMKNLLHKVLHLKITREGLFSSQGETDPYLRANGQTKPHHLLKAYYKADSWNTYYCSKSRSIELNLIELCNICKNIKKKFNLLLYIKKDLPNRLYIIPLPPSINYEDYNHLARRLPITDISLSFSTENCEFNYQFHNGLTSNIFHSMCKNFAGAKCAIFSFLMYPSGRIFCTSEGIFSDCLFENGKGTEEERKHEEKYRRYIEHSLEKNEEDDDLEDNIDEIEKLSSFSFYTGTFNCRFLKEIQKLNGYGSIVHIYADPIDQDNEDPSRPLCFKCTAPDSFVLEIYVKSNEQVKYEEGKNLEY